MIIFSSSVPACSAPTSSRGIGAHPDWLAANRYNTRDVPSLARVAHVSDAHFIRTFRATFGETPHRYLQRRRVERAMSLLCESERSVTEVCYDVGLGTFSRTFGDIAGIRPTAYRLRADVHAVPSCFTRAWTKPSSFG